MLCRCQQYGLHVPSLYSPADFVTGLLTVLLLSYMTLPVYFIFYLPVVLKSLSGAHRAGRHRGRRRLDPPIGPVPLLSRPSTFPSLYFPVPLLSYWLADWLTGLLTAPLLSFMQLPMYFLFNLPVVVKNCKVSGLCGLGVRRLVLFRAPCLLT